jgi:ribonuclease VapC
MIAFFEDEKGADKVQDVLKSIIYKKAGGFMSVINIGEVYYNISREQGEAAALDVMNQIRKYPIKIIDADLNLTLEAAKLKAAYRIAYADCFAAALCKSINGELVTGDPEFKKLGNFITIGWIV